MMKAMMSFVTTYSNYLPFHGGRGMNKSGRGGGMEVRPRRVVVAEGEV
jgi:hypothetical protein